MQRGVVVWLAGLLLRLPLLLLLLLLLLLPIMLVAVWIPGHIADWWWRVMTWGRTWR